MKEHDMFNRCVSLVFSTILKVKMVFNKRIISNKREELKEKLKTTNDPWALFDDIKYRYPWLLDDEELILLVMDKMNSGQVLSKVSGRLKDTESVVLKAVGLSEYMISHASPRLQQDVDFLISAAQGDRYTLSYMLSNMDNRYTNTILNDTRIQVVLKGIRKV